MPDAILTATEPLGIDSLKLALKTVSDFREQIAQTKKFSFLSAIGFMDDLLALGAVVTSWKQIVAEWKDRDQAEVQELLDYAKASLKIPSAEVQEFVEDAFDWILTTIKLVEKARLLKKK